MLKYGKDLNTGDVVFGYTNKNVWADRTVYPDISSTRNSHQLSLINNAAVIKVVVTIIKKEWVTYYAVLECNRMCYFVADALYETLC